MVPLSQVEKFGSTNLKVTNSLKVSLKVAKLFFRGHAARLTKKAFFPLVRACL